MKKSLLLLLVAMSVCLSGFAQKGRQAVGVDVPFRFTNIAKDLSMGIGVKYQYNVSDYVCIEPIFQYYFLNTVESYNNFDRNAEYELSIMLNSKFFFTSSNRLRPYGIIGLGYYSGIHGVDEYDGHYENYSGGAMGQIGIGLDYRLHYDWSWNLEIGGQYPFKHGMDMFAGIYVSTGLTYNF